MARNQFVSKGDVKVSNDSFQCISEIYEDGKLIHYLYDPTEKDSVKAWKKSEVCTR